MKKNYILLLLLLGISSSCMATSTEDLDLDFGPDLDFGSGCNSPLSCFRLITDTNYPRQPFVSALLQKRHPHSPELNEIKQINYSRGEGVPFTIVSSDLLKHN